MTTKVIYIFDSILDTGLHEIPLSSVVSVTNAKSSNILFTLISKVGVDSSTSVADVIDDKTVCAIIGSTSNLVYDELLNSLDIRLK